MHSSRRFKGKLTERWGRKASGLRDIVPMTAGLPGSNVNSLRRGLWSDKRRRTWLAVSVRTAPSLAA